MFLPTETSTFSARAIRKFTSDQNTKTSTTYLCSKRYSDIVQTSVVHVSTGTRKVLRFPCNLLSRQNGVRGSRKQNSAHSELQHFRPVSGHFQATVVLIPGKGLWYPLYRRLCGPQMRAGHGEGENSLPTLIAKRLHSQPKHIALI